MNIEDIRNYIINRIEENLNLDYKAAESLQRNDKKTNEISKDVSAFANSDGGLIIYGIKENPNDRHLPDSIDPIDRKVISKEWLEQIIHSKIRPRIDNITIHSISVDENTDDVIYVIEIPQSETAHQANDRKYYKRFNFSSEPMYDYEIRDVLNRIKTPRIDLEFEITKHTKKIEQKNYGFPSLSFKEKGVLPKEEPKIEIKITYKLRVIAKNNGNILVNYLNSYLFIPTKYKKNNSKDDLEISKIFMDNTLRDIVDSQYVPNMNGGYSVPKYGPSRYDPILPKMHLIIKEIEINEFFLSSQEDLKWLIYADNAETRKGSLKISEIKIFDI